MIVLPNGPTTAKIMLVGEAPGETEERLGIPFVGQSGQELDRMLEEAGILRSECFATNVVRIRPPQNKIEHFIPERKKDITPDCVRLHDRMVKPIVVEGYNQLLKEISLVRPNVIVALGNVPMWALTHKWGITTWRGSLLSLDLGPTKVIPVYHPAAILRVWDWRFITVHDLRRARAHAGSPAFPKQVSNYIVQPSAREALYIIQRLREQLPLGRFEVAVDIETRQGLMTCIGLAWTAQDAITIPFATPQGNYFSFEEEVEIVWQLIQLLTHENAYLILQNGPYDAQYLAKEWGILIKNSWDTMIQHHVLFAGLPKNLGFLSSLYLDDHVQWKDDPQDVEYNPKDCTKTYAIAEVERRSLKQMALDGPSKFQQRLLPAVLNIMLFGMKIDQGARKALGEMFEVAIKVREEWLRYVLQHPFNPRSPQQMQRLFYEDFKLPIQWNRKNSPPTPTCDDDALSRLSEKEPLVAPLCSVIGDIRSFNVFLKTFIQSPLDSDGRMRGTLNIAGTESYRFSSSENAFGNGMNLENIPSDKSMSVIKFQQRLRSSPFRDFKLPNIREMFIPDEGMTIADADLDRADLQVVVWEADDEGLKKALREGLDLHLYNARDLFRLPFSDDDLKDPSILKQLKTRYANEREFAKRFIHGCVTAGHEVLTLKGWIPIEQAADGEVILVCTPDGSSAHFEEIANWYRSAAQTDLISFEGEAISQTVTADHSMSYKTDDKGLWRGQAQFLPASARLPKAVILNGPVIVTHPELLAAFQADGHLDAHGNLIFRLKKDRKINRLRALLEGFEFSLNGNRDESVTFYIPHRVARTFALTKTLSASCLSWSHDSAVRYLTEQVLWDGHESATAKWMSSIDGNRANWAHTLSHLHGFGSQLHAPLIRENKQPLWRWSINNRTWWRLSSTQVTRFSSRNLMVYCPVTSTGFWLVRHNGKISVTGNTNYGGGAKTMAETCRITIAEASYLQSQWFERHPGIAKWHTRTSDQLMGRRYVENKFGYRRFYFDRIEGLLGEALAWVPQSTVACVVNRGLVNIFENLPEVQLLNQVHDSLVVEVPTSKWEELKPQIINQMLIEIPYDDPLVIPVGIKSSTISWGHCT